ncbi:MAG TPA: LysM peptidoglycan-binding domain-containing protein, partial [Ilumatobacteraceae bacterium]|nr:LysM peptidoglycan-binding domain-containing protein [Ilumatobacteraceae bacterium]
MKREPIDVARVLSSIVALVALVVALGGLIAVSRARFGSANPLAGVDLGWFGDDATSTLTQPIADNTVIDGLIRLSLCVAWVAIAVIVVTTVLEVVHMIRHRGLPTPSVRGLGWAQRIARFIAVGLIVLIPLSTSSPSIATSLSGRVAATLPREAEPSAVVESSADARVASTPAIATSGTSMATHVVQPGESVYSIAERLAAVNGANVIEVAEQITDANLDATMGPGQRFTTPAYIEAGWVLQIPAHLVTAPVGQPAAPPVDESVYTVQRGDTLWDIADEQLGDPTAWPEIWNDNAGDDMGGGRTFDDPDLILPGWELDLAGADPAEVADTPAEVAPVAAPPDVVAPPEVVATPEVAAIESERAPVTATPGTPTSTVPTSTVPTSTTPPTSSTTSTISAGVGGGDAAGMDQAPAEDPGAPSPLRIEHAALLAAGVLALVGVRRRQRLRAAMPRH